jgi:TNF receptor-associated protein 1
LRRLASVVVQPKRNGSLAGFTSVNSAAANTPSLSFASSFNGARFYSSSKSACDAETMEFQAETRKLLDIVTNSIYTDKEVFIRELISNASDALEKLRYSKTSGKVVTSDDDAMMTSEINIITDPKEMTLTIVDNGIGMSKSELIRNLGTIARSGSKEFISEHNANGEEASGAVDGIIGQFGVGFYSSFMVAEKVSVESISGIAGDSSGVVNRWSSDGSGQFSVETLPADHVTDLSTHGTKIVMQLKKSCKEYADKEKLKAIIKKYSNFVAFPVKVDGEVVNTVTAIWTQEKTSVTEEQYDEFYRFIANAYDKPKYRLHFRTDAPIDLKCLFYIPTFHGEKFGQGRTELGVNLYSRKVLIESKPKDLLPEWLRFCKGAVDSEDLPLSLSREKPQDSGLLRRIKDVLTRKLLRFFSDQLKLDFTTYKEFYIEYQMFLKEGLCQDYKYMDQLSKLLLFETSFKGDGELITLDDYISRCSPEQKKIYYLVAPNRDAALNSPYYETFKKHDTEVLFLYNTIDDFVMTNLKQHGGRFLVSAETSSIDLSKDTPAKAEEDKTEEEKKEAEEKGDEIIPSSAAKLTDEESKDFCAWLTSTLGSKVREVKITTRLSGSPAIVTDHESGAMRRMLKMVEQANAGKTTNQDLPPQVLEINPSHPLVVKLFSIKDDPSSAAGLVAEQLLDNALMSAGLIEDPRFMIPRLNEILLATMNAKK